MNWETVIIAAITALSTALVALSPVYLKLREDRRIEKTRSEDTARMAQIEAIRLLTERVEALEKDRDEMEEKLDQEREKRREAETKLVNAEIEIARLKAKVERLEKGDTGPLRARN